MSKFETALFETDIKKIDFGRLAQQLQAPDSPIRVVLHVKERRMLCLLAQRLDLEQTDPLFCAAAGDRRWLEKMVEGGLVMSSRTNDREEQASRFWIPLGKIDPGAQCEFLPVPPYCVAYTAGLFSVEQQRPQDDEPRSRGEATRDSIRDKYLKEMGLASEEASETKPQRAQEADNHQKHSDSEDHSRDH